MNNILNTMQDLGKKYRVKLEYDRGIWRVFASDEIVFYSESKNPEDALNHVLEQIYLRENPCQKLY